MDEQVYQAKRISDLIEIYKEIEPGQVVMVEVPRSERKYWMSTQYNMMYAAEGRGYPMKIVEADEPNRFLLKRDNGD